MDKIELRIDKDQADLIIYGLGLARDMALSQQHKGKFSDLRAWILSRRLRRWGDETANTVTGLINADVSRDAH